MGSTLMLGVAQSPGELKNSTLRIEWLAECLKKHQDDELDLVVLPELFQCGYNIGRQVIERAENCDGQFASAIRQLARSYHTAICYGYCQTLSGKVFNSARCIDKNGNEIGHQQKLLLPPGFEGDHFSSGKHCQLFELGPFTIAILICYDAEFPENMRHVALKGVDLVVVPTALGSQWGVVSECVIPTRAFENGIFVCYANHCGQENGLEYFGGSCIIAPDGNQLARAGSNEAFLTARLEHDAVKSAQKRLPYFVDRMKLPWVES